MTDLCGLVNAFADGELEADEAEAFRAHLASCAACQAELHDIVQLGLVVSAHADLGAPVAVFVPGAPAPSFGDLGSVTSVQRLPRRSRLIVAGLVATALAASLVVVLKERAGVGGGPRGGDELAGLVGARGTRLLPGRLARPEAAAHRPYDVALGEGNPAAPLPEGAVLERLEARGDLWAVGTALLVDGDAAGARSWLARAEQTPAVLSDRAAAELALHQPAQALAFVDTALAMAPQGRAAQWNRALALADLGLPRTAAAAFAQLAQGGEPGWSDEAAARLRRLDPAGPRAVAAPAGVPSPAGTSEHAQAQQQLQAGAPAAALATAQRGYFLARGEGDAAAEEVLLGDAAAAARAVSAPSLARAYTDELQLRQKPRAR